MISVHRTRPTSKSTCFAKAALALGAIFLTMNASAETSKAALEAGRLNNVGTALMNQQLTEKALQKFEDAHKTDPSAVIPVVNEGIALLYLQRLPEAEAALKQATTMDPNNAHAWYALGLTHFDEGNPKLAIEDMQRVVKIDPTDADAHYFLGSFCLNLADYPRAKDEFETALKLNPLHASAQFGLARALQRMGQTDAARERLVRFQELVQSKADLH